MSTDNVVKIPLDLFVDIQNFFNELQANLHERKTSTKNQNKRDRAFVVRFQNNSEQDLADIAADLTDFATTLGIQAATTTAAVAAERSNEADFSEFLSEIGEAVVDAQRKLDDQSAAYLREIKGKEHVMPSVFRIPKVSANMKFAMKERREKGFNIIFAKNKRGAEISLNQGLDFEVVAVPPPPEVMAQLAERGLPGLAFELSRLVRDEVFERLDEIHGENSRMKLDMLTEAGNRDRVVMVHVGVDDRQVYLILFATRIKEGEGEESEVKGNVGVWYLESPEKNMEPGSDSEWTAHMLVSYVQSASGGKTKTNYIKLRDLVFGLGERQEKLIQGHL